MLDIFDSIARVLYDFFQNLGIEPIYAGTILLIIFTCCYWKTFTNWDQASPYTKKLAGLTLIATFIAIIFCIFKFMGVGNL